MELVSYDIRVSSRSKDPPTIIMPIGDIQWSGKRGDTALETLKRQIALGQANKAWYVGMGDMIDFASPSNRQRLRAAALYDTALDVIDDKAMELTEELYREVLKPTKGRWLGLLEGHHFTQLKTGITTDQRLCDMLNARFLGTSAFIRLQFIRGCRNCGNVTLFCHHGAGGGMRAGSPLNKLDMLSAYFDADVLLMGHVTKKVCAPLNRIVPVWNGKGEPHLVHKTIYIASTGGYSKSYQENRVDGVVPRGNYVEQKMLTPAALGSIVIRIQPHWSSRGHSAQWEPEISVEV